MSSARILADLFEHPESKQLRTQMRLARAEELKQIISASAPIVELDDVIETLSRPGLLGLAGKAVRKRCTRDLESYFKALAKEVKKLKLQELASGTMTAEIARHGAVMRLQNVVRHARPVLQALLEDNMSKAMLVSDKISEFAEATQPQPGSQPPIPPSFLGFGGQPDITDQLGLSGQAAAQWASQNAAQLVTGIDQTTIDLIAAAIAEGIEESLGVSGTASLITNVLNQMSTQRALMIATTEMASAMSEAALQKLTRLGIEYKQWILGPNPCEICQENEDAGAIAVDEDFPSGDARPPAHPNCVCAVTGARAPEEETIQ